MQTVTRLLDTFTPKHYDLTLHLERVEREFSGTVAISGSLKEAANSITLHAKDLKITAASIDGAEATTQQGANDELALKTTNELAGGEHTITLSFKGEVTDGMHGLYPCYYEHEGEKKEVLATQFESHHAREVFPCIDEPAAKATFDVALFTEKDLAVLGNMPVVQQNEEDGKLKTTFDTTPRMSTYLLAFVVGDLQKATAMSKTGVEVNIWATKAQPAASLGFALGVATQAIDFFSDYFGTPYPLPKADHVALPDFSAGAMENWGLITYREIALLVDPNKTTTAAKQYTAIVICHELSHQWFGNLVTMQWWDDLWLNESFATIMEYIAVDHLFPEWQIWLDFTSSEAISALRRDSLPGVQAVKTDVNHPDEISTLFDPSIVYAKGARTLRMLRSYIGDEAFQEGLRAYFQKHAYQNTVGNDLWEALSKASHKDIPSFMASWIEKSGYPIVNAMADGDSLRLTQHQFLVGAKPTDNKLWPIPLHANQATLPELFDTEELTVAFDANTYLKLNQEDTAHYVTKYDDGLRQKLVEAIANNKLAPVDRLQILHEATLLPRADEASSAALVDLLEAYKNEDTESVWDVIALALGDLKRFVENDEAAEESLRAFTGKIVDAMYQKLGWDAEDDEPATNKLLRSTVIGLKSFSHEQPIIDEALRRFATNRHDIGKIDSDLRAIILGVAIRFADDHDAIVNELVELYKTTSSGDIQMDICSALTATKDEKTYLRLLELMKDTKTIRPQDTARWFAYLLRNKHSREAAWQWMQNNWDWLKEAFSGDKSYDNFPRYTGSLLVTRQQLDEYRAFFTPLKNEPALARAIEIGLADIEGRVNWLERDGEAVRARLKELQ